MSLIKEIHAREILNSNGIPTIETNVILEDGSIGIASTPTPSTPGNYEVKELRDNDPNRFHGQGVLKAIYNVRTIIAKKLIGLEATQQQLLDKMLIELDGTPDKSRLGANAILSISIATAKASAQSLHQPLFLYLKQLIAEKHPLKIPLPIFSIINGGKIGTPQIDMQEILAIPASSKNFSESIQIGTTIHNALYQLLSLNGFSTLTGLQGGFGAKVTTNHDALSIAIQAAQTTPYRVGYDVFFGLNAAANNFYRNQQYVIKDKGASLPSKNLIDFYQELIKQFHLIYLEDPFAEEDWDGWAEAVKQLYNSSLIVGGNLLATNPYRLQTAVAKKAVTGICINPGQIGTVLEAIAVTEIARAAGLKIIVADRDQETNDDFIADFAVAVSADYVKCGAINRGEHTAKYNRLLQIHEYLKAANVQQNNPS